MKNNKIEYSPLSNANEFSLEYSIDVFQISSLSNVTFSWKNPQFFTMIKSFVVCLLVVCGLIINKFYTSLLAGREDAPYKSINCDGIFAIVVSTVTPAKLSFQWW